MTAVNSSGKRAFFHCPFPWSRCCTCVRPPGQSFEWEAGKVNQEGVHISLRLLRGSDRDSFGSPYATCHRYDLKSDIQKRGCSLEVQIQRL